MGQVLGLGVSHFPPLSGGDADMANILRGRLADPDIPADAKDPARWPAPMQAEWADPVDAAARHRAAMRAGLQRVRRALADFGPDFVLIWGDDQYENFKESIVPRSRCLPTRTARSAPGLRPRPRACSMPTRRTSGAVAGETCGASAATRRASCAATARPPSTWLRRCWSRTQRPRCGERTMSDALAFTACLVAVARGLGEKLPAEARLAEDPYGLLFVDAPTGSLLRHAPPLCVTPYWPLALHLQVRTRAIDDALRHFIGREGRQVVILGAGYDCRAARLAEELHGARVFEVDRPATQARKRGVLESAHVQSGDVQYLAWDFERKPLDMLPAALAARGHDAAQPTFTLCEGVTMYLSARAIDDTFAAVRLLSAPGSPFVFTYFDRVMLESPTLPQAMFNAFVASVGEPFRFGWIPGELAGWLRDRGFARELDRPIVELARDLLPPRLASWVLISQAHFAIASRQRE